MSPIWNTFPAIRVCEYREKVYILGISPFLSLYFPESSPKMKFSALAAISAFLATSAITNPVVVGTPVAHAAPVAEAIPAAEPDARKRKGLHFKFW
ncbi:hypothetical protein BABINDRAFT_160711 [Babjeviella inositovora NRRL Y-12698]|uniref:Uncharacterized protein n=1 Tax=Babjeviella inositovora NRRL Y-12698 TaxID=984486 RepID=A0A1E3QWH4_9ASCO|nr:uncharacterized protein BABINDRAFT_160711 [Babjeviella inositovora NRRL Y-12698]ODQ81357.1 hypothetical protein BABINDRAFT_160711 [Babjeviella inositovora NRRL Y-12698]